MTTLKFADTHNMVAFLSKPKESDGFEQIVDFLNAHPIKYALTVNPIIYTSCIEQFWSTVKAKTVNGEVQLQALVDGKKIIVTEASVRSDLQLDDEEGMDCLPNATIFEELTRMGYEKISQKLTFYKAFFSPQWKFLIHTILQCLSSKTTAWNEFSSTMASAIICLATNQKFNFSKYIFESMVKNLENVSGLYFLNFFIDPRIIREQSIASYKGYRGGVLRSRGGRIARWKVFRGVWVSRLENGQQGGDVAFLVTKGGKIFMLADRMVIDRLRELIYFSYVSYNLEKTKTSQAQEITSLKRRVKILEKKGGSRTHRLKRLYKVVLSIRVESSNKEGLGEEDASKQGRIADIDADTGINLVSTHFNADTYMFRAHDLVGNEVVVESEVVVKAASTIPVSAATTTTTVRTNDEITLAKAVAELKSDKLLITIAAITITVVSRRPRAKGLVIHEQDYKARVEADYQLAQRLQAQEQEELTDEEKARLFIQLLEARKKHFAAIRAKEKRNKPPTKAQKINTMSTYLKTWLVNTFVDIDTESVEDSEQKVDEDKETTELQRLIEVVPDKEEVAIDAIPLATKPPSIVDYKIHKEGKKTYY
ncbi:hypothetical protein Tco_0031541 [Tanacetum coccineum]